MDSAPPRQPADQTLVAGATAAAAGAIAGAVVVLSRQSIIDWTRLCVAATALLLLVRLKVKEPYLVGLAAAAGLALYPGW